MTNSGGMCIAIHRSLGVIMCKSFDIPGHMLVLDLDGTPNNAPKCIIGIYAPSISQECSSFFYQVFDHVASHTVLLGDFNSMTDGMDRFSGTLDKTSSQLSHLLNMHSFTELQGSHHYTFTSHHPTVSHRKSRLD